MSHLDDSIIAELIDGELDTAARAAATAHLAACAECRARHAEALACAGESDRLIAAVGLPHPLRPLRSQPAPIPGHIPRRIPWRALGWAATIVLAVGIGYSAGVPGPGARGAIQDAPAGLAQPELEEERDRSAAAPESTSGARQEALARDQSVAPAAPGVPKQFALPRADRPSSTEATPATSSPEERDGARPPAPQTGALASDPKRAGRNASAEAKAEAAPSFRAFRRDDDRPATVVSLEEAVTRLGGSIRLIDGMTPVAVRLLAAPVAPEAGEGGATLRVVYLDPPSRELWLDQRRISSTDPGARLEAALLPGDTIGVTLPDGRRSLEWRDAGGFQLFLSGFLPADSLHMLARRVR